MPPGLDLRKALGAGQGGERERLRHRLDVLELVLRDHADEEVVVELREQPEHGFPNLAHVGARRRRVEDRQAAAVRPSVGERVIEVVALRGQWGTSTGAPKQPELFEVADVREVPHERRLQRRHLTHEQLVVERLEQRQRSPSRVTENAGELSR